MFPTKAARGNFLSPTAQDVPRPLWVLQEKVVTGTCVSFLFLVACQANGQFVVLGQIRLDPLPAPFGRPGGGAVLEGLLWLGFMLNVGNDWLQMNKCLSHSG